MSAFVRLWAQHKRKLVIGGTCGLLLASAAIWFFSTIWDPFAEPIDDLLAIVPNDAPMVVEVRDFPTLIKGLENREFVTCLERNRAFQRWLESPDMRDSGLVESLRRAWRTLIEGPGVELPGDLSIAGDLSGEQVVAWGRPAEKEGELPLFVCAMQPSADRLLMAVNVLCHETLCNWFVKDGLAEQGGEIEHTHFGAVLTLPQDGKKIRIGLARIDRMIVVGTDVDGIAALVKRAATNGFAPTLQDRYAPGWVWKGSPGSSVHVVLDQDLVDKNLDLRRRFLEPAWGSDYADAFERLLPDDDGRDLYLGIDLDAVAELRIARAVRPRRPADPVSTSHAIDRSRMRAQLDGFVGHLPGDVFAYSYLQVEPSRLLDWCFREPAIVPLDKRNLMSEELGRALPRFREGAEGRDLVPELLQTFDRAFSDEVGIVLFDKGQSQEQLHDEPGFALAFRVRDRAYLVDFIRELDETFERPFEQYDLGRFTAWENTRKRWLDDPLKNRPGLALMDDWFLVTNWFPLFLHITEVESGQRAGFQAKDQLAFRLDLLDEATRGFLHLDAAALYRHMDSVKRGWVQQRSQITEGERFRARSRVAAEAVARGVPAADRARYEEEGFQRWLRDVTRERDPLLIEERINRQLDYFRDGFSYFFVDFGLEGIEFRVQLELRARETL